MLHAPGLHARLANRVAIAAELKEHSATVDSHADAAERDHGHNAPQAIALDRIAAEVVKLHEAADGDATAAQAEYVKQAATEAKNDAPPHWHRQRKAKWDRIEREHRAWLKRTANTCYLDPDVTIPKAQQRARLRKIINLEDTPEWKGARVTYEQCAAGSRVKIVTHPSGAVAQIRESRVLESLASL